MKNIFKVIGLLSFIAVTFFYTDKVMHVIREEDKIMIEINQIKDSLKKVPINAQINNDEIIPGINGKEVNAEKSYKFMKNNGVFRIEDIVYNTITPDVTIENHKDKYIVSGNSMKHAVSLIFILNSKKYLEKLERIFDDKNIVVNYFVDDSFLILNSTMIKDMSNREFYNYGDDGNYTPDNIIFSNNLISRISNHHSNLCLVIKKDKNTIDICSKNNLYTILPNKIIEKNPYMMLKNNINIGDMILLPITQATINELPIIIDYIKGKGIDIIGLNDLLSEEIDEK